ncbi:MAG: MOSC domain-containing protein [Acidobacteriota bacterium]|nr:MOSC domain-containing protein [Acidobacteriota bacterium]
MTHQSMIALEAGLDAVGESPSDGGAVKLIVRRPSIGERETVAVGELSLTEGLVGDNWQHRGSSRTDDGSAHPEMQLNLMNSRVADLVAVGVERWPLTGDQLFVDLDLSFENLPPRTRLGLGSAVIEVTPEPHTGCNKFVARFGLDAVKFVNSERGRQLRLRGLNAKVVQPGTVRVGDTIRKLDASSETL